MNRRGGGSLDPMMVARWKRSIGLGDPQATGIAVPIHLKGRAGVAAHPPGFEVRVPDPSRFEALIYGRQLETMGVHVGLYSPCGVERSAASIRKAPLDALMVTVHAMAGRMATSPRGHGHSFAAGQMVIVNSDEPFFQENQSVSDRAGVMVPLDLLGTGRHGNRRPLRPVACDTPLSSATARFLRRFVCDASVGARPTDLVSEEAVLDLIRAVIDEYNYDSYRLEDQRLFVRETTLDLIDRHYGDSEFSADTIAAMLHISRRQLYRYFADADATVATLITDRRLARAREMLIATALAGTSGGIDEVAAASGFASTATLRNRFRAAYGLTPSAFQEQCRAGLVVDAAPTIPPPGRPVREPVEAVAEQS